MNAATTLGWPEGAIVLMRDALRKIAGNGDATGCNPQIMCDIATAALKWPAKAYRGWSISYDAKPIPIRDCDWVATSPDYDASWEGEEDGWVASGGHVHAATYEELLAEIDEVIAGQDGEA